MENGLSLMDKLRSIVWPSNDPVMLKHKPDEVRKCYPLEFESEIFSRIETFFGKVNFTKLHESFVIVVGLGGVGSHAVNMLVRSGVQKVRVIDFDQVSLSSLNRHALATLSDVGKPKSEVTRDRLLSVVPWCEIDSRNEMFKADKANELLSAWMNSNQKPDYVLDCIDDVNTKADLISYCINNNLKVLTSMGAGGKADPTRLRIAPLSDCVNDPLASKIKWKLKKYSIEAESVMSLFSVEKPTINLLPLEEEQFQAGPQSYGAVDDMRVRVMPVLGTSPSIFGQAMTSYVLCQLAGRPYEPEMCEKLSNHLKHKIKQQFRNNELYRFQSDEFIDLDDDDIDFIVCQVWRSRCAVTSRKFGAKATLVLTRWDPEQPPTPYNLVLLMTTELDKMVGCKVKAKQRVSADSDNDEVKHSATQTINNNAVMPSTIITTTIAAADSQSVDATAVGSQRQQSLSPTREQKLMKAQSMGRLLPGFTAAAAAAAAAVGTGSTKLSQSSRSPSQDVTNISLSSSSSSTSSASSALLPVNNVSVFTQMEARQGVRSHLPEAVINRINARLAWAKELYTRHDYDYSLPPPPRSHIYSSSYNNNTINSNTNKSNSALYNKESLSDLSKGFLAGALFTAAVSTVTLFAILHRKN